MPTSTKSSRAHIRRAFRKTIPIAVLMGAIFLPSAVAPMAKELAAPPRVTIVPGHTSEVPPPASSAAAAAEPEEKKKPEAKKTRKPAAKRASRATRATPRGGPALVKRAARYVGRWGGHACRDVRSDIVNGQCKQFVGCLLRQLNGGQRILDGSYYTGYAAAGAKKVSLRNARPGDIIQLNAPKGRGRNSFRYGMHTAIVLKGGKNNVVQVIDSNFYGLEKVRKRWWRPYSTARAFGLQVHVWRFPG